MNTLIFRTIRFKTAAALLTLSMGALFVFYYSTFSLVSRDKEATLFERNLMLIQRIGFQLKGEMGVRLHTVGEVVNWAKQHYGIDNSVHHYDFSLLPLAMSKDIFSIRIYQQEEKENTTLLKLNNENDFSKKEEQVSAWLDEQDKSFLGVKSENVLKFRSTVYKGKGQAYPLFVLDFPLITTKENKKPSRVLAYLDQSSLQNIFQSVDTGELYWLTEDHKLISHAGPQSQADAHALGTTLDHPALRLTHKSELGVTEEVEWNDKKYLSSYLSVDMGGTQLLYQIDLSEAMLPLREFQKRTLLLALGISCFGLLLALVFSKRLTSGIEILKTASLRIAGGDFSQQVNVKTKDELEEVGESFNFMQDKIAELIEKTKTTARMQHELETAKTVQDVLLSSQSIEVPEIELGVLYQPATECCGDLWDMRRVGSKVRYFLGDATGHGVPAALLVAAVKTCLIQIHEKSETTPSLPITLKTLNNAVCDAFRGERLMTLVAVEVDLLTGNVTVCNAGHEQPYKVDSVSVTESKTDPIVVTGERLGFSKESVYQSYEFVADSNQSLVLFTDGVVDIKNAEGKTWGERKLRKVLTQFHQSNAKEICKKIETTTSEFKGKTPLEDDVTLLVLKIKKSFQQPFKKVS